jgi:hypothetical protein
MLVVFMDIEQAEFITQRIKKLLRLSSPDTASIIEMMA